MMPHTLKPVVGAMPCGCGKGIIEVEKAGKSVCRYCAQYLRGREMPVRAGSETAQLVSFRKNLDA